MDTIFYALPQQIAADRIELTGQEAHHASNVLRASAGDAIQVVDGRGNRYKGTIRDASKRSILIDVDSVEQDSEPRRELVLGLGIIKNRQRLEYAVEKAVELGAREIVLMQTDHTEKSKVRTNRLERLMVSAMKQSLRSYLPELRVYRSVDEVLDTYDDYEVFIAHEKADASPGISNEARKNIASKILLLVGPEGGFSEEEVELVSDRGGGIVSLGRNRLRAETAVVALMSQFLQ